MIKQKIMVCVTEQKTCERLIKKGIELTKDNDTEIFVLHVATKDIKVIEDPRAAEELEYIFEESKKYGASVTVLKYNDILKTLSKFAIENDIDYMILGETRLQNEKDSVIFKLRKELGTTKTKIEVVPLKSN